MYTNKEDFEKIITHYSGIKDPGMLDGSVQYATILWKRFL